MKKCYKRVIRNVFQVLFVFSESLFTNKKFIQLDTLKKKVRIIKLNIRNVTCIHINFLI